MSKKRSLLPFLGSLKGFSVYTMKGVEGPVLRRKAGPSKLKFQTADSFENTRRTCREFGGRSKAVGLLREAALSLATCADISCAGRLNKMLVPLQHLDNQSSWGQRHVLLSQSSGLLTGFEFAQTRPLEAVLRNPVVGTLSKEGLNGRIEVPALLPGINFLPGVSHPWFRVVAVLGAVPDVMYDGAENRYRPVERWAGIIAQETQTPWQVTKAGAPASSLEITLQRRPADNRFSLMLTVGILFGTLGSSGAVEPVKSTGSARILAMT